MKWMFLFSVFYILNKNLEVSLSPFPQYGVKTNSKKKYIWHNCLSVVTPKKSIKLIKTLISYKLIYRRDLFIGSNGH